MDVGLILTAFGGMLAGFYGLVRLLLTQSVKDREADRKERTQLANAIRLMAKNSSKVAAATEKSAKEAKDRNGHLGDQNIQIAQLVTSQNKDISSIKKTNAEIASTLRESALITATDKKLLQGDQFVKEQTVVHQTVNNKE